MLTQRLSQTGREDRPRALGMPLRPALLLAIFLLLPGCMSTRVRTAEDPSGAPVRIAGTVVLVEPDIELYEVLAGGAQEPRQAWTESARRLYPIAAREVLQAQGVALSSQPFDIPEDPQTHLRQLYLLNQAVSISILQHTQAGGKLRNKHDRFDWTLGPGVADLRSATGADYALFTYLRDSYTSSGRVAMRVIGFLLLGGDIGGGTQVGLASLVDLRTGQVVWHNLLLDQTGDLRDPAGARETAGDLLKEIRR
jgi:hypothetical protein